MPIENLKNELVMKSSFLTEMEIALARYKKTTSSTIKSNVIFIGDSAIEGAGASDFTKAYVALVQKTVMERQMSNPETEYTEYASEAIATGQSMITKLTGTFSNIENENCTVQDGGVNLSPRGWCQTVTDGDKYEVTPFGYALKVLFASDDAIDDSTTPGTVDISIDGGAPTVVDLSGEDKYKWYEIQSTAGTTTVTIEANISGSQSVAIESMHLLNNFDGVRVINFSTGGSNSQDWADHLNIIDAFEPVTTFLSVGGNDIFHGIDSIDFENNLNEIIDKCQTYGDVVYLFYVPIVTEEQDYLDEIDKFRLIAHKVCKEQDIKIIDFHEVFIDGATADANGLMADAIHPNDTGFELLYRYLLNNLSIS